MFDLNNKTNFEEYEYISIENILSFKSVKANLVPQEERKLKSIHIKELYENLKI